jgi:hypothetical protein
LTSTATIDAFVQDAFAAFEVAFSHVEGAVVRDLSLGGHHVRIRVAAPQLDERFHPAFAHAALESGAGRPDLVIACWDGAVSGVAPPAPPWRLEDFLPNARIRGLVEGPVRASFDPSARVLCLYERNRGRALVYAADNSSVPTWMDRAPFRTVLTWWAADRGLVLLHASAVAFKGRAIAFAGPSGAGKSTTALACLTRGLDMIGDDACLVDLGGEPLVFAVYGRAKVEPDVLAALPALKQQVSPLGDELVLGLGPRLVERAALRAVAVPHVIDTERSRAVPMSPGDALRALATSTVLEGVGGGSLPAFGELARRVPCVHLELGSDPDAVVRAVRDLLGSKA